MSFEEICFTETMQTNFSAKFGRRCYGVNVTIAFLGSRKHYCFTVDVPNLNDEFAYLICMADDSPLYLSMVWEHASIVARDGSGYVRETYLTRNLYTDWTVVDTALMHETELAAVLRWRLETGEKIN